MNSKKRVQKHSKFNIKFYSVALYAKFFVFTCLLGFISLSTLSVDNLLLIPTAYAAQGISHTVNYQGKLMDAVGTPVVDGSYNMRFVIYDASSGGSQLWSASTTNGLPTGTVASFPITVTSGLFSILLGDVSDGQVAFPDNIFNNDSLYLGITIGSDSEMTPRKRLSAVPYAFNSETLQGQYASNTVANTGGDLFALNQNTADSASASRTALAIYTSGTSNINDFLIRANSGSDVFSISRQGNVTTTGNLQVDGISVLGSTTTTGVTFNGYINSDFNPYTDNNYSLGSSAYRWKNLYATNVSSTNIDALGYVSTTNLYLNGSLFNPSGSTSTFQDVTDNGNITTNTIGIAGASSTGHLLPTTNNLYDLGSVSLAWRNLFAINGIITNVSSTNIDASGYISANTLISNSANLGNATTTNLYNSGTVSTTQLYINGTQITGIESQNLQNVTDLGATTNHWIQFAGATSTNNFLPGTDNLYSLGSSAYRWFGVNATNVTTTNLAADYVTTTDLWVNGTQITGAAPNLQQVTDVGATTTNRIQFAGATSTNDIKLIGNLDNTLNASQVFGYSTTSLIVGGSVADIFVVGNYLYVTASESSGYLRIFDIADKNNIFAVSTTTLPHGTNHNRLYVTGNYAFAVDPNNDYLNIVDVSDPGTPIFVTSTYLGSSVGTVDVSVQGQYAYVTAYGGLYVLDLSDISNPRLVYSDSDDSGAMVIQGKYIFAADDNFAGNDSLQITDISNPLSPSLVNTFTLGTDIDPTDIYVQGDYAYLACVGGYSTPTLQVVDISDVLNPVIINTTSLSTYAERIHGSGRYVYLGNGSIYDVYDPSNPIAILDSATPLQPVFSTGRYTYIGNNPWPGGDLVILDNGGIETNGLMAHNAQLGSVQVLGDGQFLNKLNINGSLNVGSGGIYSNGALAIFGTSTMSDIQLSGRVNSDLLPHITDTYNIGNNTYRWLGLNVANVTSTNILATGYVSTTNLYINGQNFNPANYFVQNGNEFGTTAVLGTNDTQQLNIVTDGSTRMSISSTGLVGIASSTPSARLSIIGDKNFPIIDFQDHGQNSRFYINKDGFIGINTSTLVGFQVNVNGDIGPSINNTYDLGANDYAWQDIHGVIIHPKYLLHMDSGSYVNGNLIPTSTLAYSLGNETYKWLGLAVGNVSSTNIDVSNYVSTTNLYVNGTQITGASSASSLQEVTDVGYITNDAIGVAGVSSTGHILPTTSLTYDLGSSSRRWNDVWASSTYIGGSTWNLRQNSAGSFVLAQDAGAERVFVGTNGRVGINASAPVGKFQVTGSENTPQIVVRANSTQSLTNPLIQIRNSGGTVIGGITTNVATNFFAGYLSGENITSGINNSFYGSESGEFVTTGEENTAVGSQALYGNYSNITGSYNTAIGAESMYGYGGSAISGDFNSAIGFQSLTSLTTGHDNTGLGYYALRLTTTGYENTAIGSTALNSNTTGIKNVAIGFQTLYTNSTTTANVGVGNEALYNNRGGDNIAIGKNASYMAAYVNESVAIGTDALFTNRINGNIGIGFNAARSNNTGARILAIGHGAMENISTGSDNTGIGFETSHNNVSGINNTALGSYALYGTYNNSHSNNTALGYYSLYGVTTGGSNVAIGSYALDANQGGSYNIAAGVNALTTNVSNSGSVAIGYNALQLANGADDLIGIGQYALASNSTGAGNVGIGRSTNYYNTTGINNVAIGYATMQGSGGTNSRSNNTAIGYYSMLDITTGHNNSALGVSSLENLTTGYQNTAIGAKSMFSMTTGASNTAVGYEALYSNSTGVWNVALGDQALRNSGSAVLANIAIGHQALYNQNENAGIAIGLFSQYTSTGGYANISMGGASLYSNLVGDRLIAIGESSLYNSTASDNMAVGWEALYSNTSGSFNTGIGQSAGYYNQTGSRNTSLGHEALQGSSSGGGVNSSNTAIGYRALFTDSSGSDNTAVGHESLTANTTGFDNSSLGANSLHSLTTGNSNVAIGKETLFSSTDDFANVAIGNQSLYNITNNQNVGVGYQALYNTGNSAGNVAVGGNAGNAYDNGSFNTFVGYNSDSAGAGYTNTMALGYGASVIGSNRIRLGNGSISNIHYAGTLTPDSDERLKKDIVDNTTGLSLILNLRPRHFVWKSNDYAQDGFIAQEVKTAVDNSGVWADLVEIPSDPNLYWGFKQEALFGPIVNSIQEIYASSSPLWNGIAIDPNFASSSPFLWVDENGNITSQELNIAKQSEATTSTPAVNSYTFSFNGSAWNSNTAQEITTSFRVFNNTISATSSELKYAYTTGTGFTQDLLTISNMGDMKVSGDLYVGKRLFLGSKSSGRASTSTYIFVDDTFGPTSTYIATNADGWQANTSYDYAERYKSSEDLQPGDLVVVDSNEVNLVKRSSSSNQIVLGIVSTKPGFMTGGPEPNTYPIALAGRVPTKVSNIKGKIEPGDFLAPSDLPGIAVKATEKGSYIGIALESFDEDTGLISVFVNIGYMGNKFADLNETQPVSNDIKGFAYIKAGSQEVTVTHTSLLAYPLIQLMPYGGVQGSYWIQDITGSSFKIMLSEPQNFDLKLGYTITVPTTNRVSVSDGTTVDMDTLTGEVLLPQEVIPQVPEVEDPPPEEPIIEEIVTAESSTSTSS